MKTEATILLITSYLMSGAIIYSNTFGLSVSVRRLLTWLPLTALVYFLWVGKRPVRDSLIFGLITGPIVIGLLYQLFDFISWKVNKRVFKLHASGSRDLMGLGLRSENTHYRWMDVIFSLVLILIWIGWPMIFVVLVYLAKGAL